MTISDVEYALKSKLGATRDRSGDHIYFYFADGGSEYTVGKLSHSWRGAMDDTQVMMCARKLHLRKREFEQFVDCSLEPGPMLTLWRQRRP
ncbi:MAG: hypothetical protein HYR51_12600 [Candidatus Rokubacteria bacterium]|nr:hypothetical protein [Candidatus Rokubacteria bacterium]